MELEKNRHKRPKGWKSGRSGDAGEAGSIHAEYCMTVALVDECTMEGALYYRPCGEDVVEAVATEVQSVNMPKVDVVQSDHENEREFDLRDNSDDKYESESDDEMSSLVPRTERYDDNSSGNESQADEYANTAPNFNETYIVPSPSLEGIIFRSTSQYANDNSNQVESGEVGLSVSALTINHLIHHDELWVGDTGATSHMTFTMQGMSNVCNPSKDECIIVGNGNTVNATKTGDVHGVLFDKDGKELGSITIEGATYTREAASNLISIPMLLDKR